MRANEPAGRAEIARSCGLSVQAVSNITEVLEGDGLLRVVGQKTGVRGKPATQYSINPEGAFAVGIELRPDALICAILNLKGECIYKERVALTNAAPDVAVPAIENAISLAIMTSKRVREQLLGIGIVMPEIGRASCRERV